VSSQVQIQILRALSQVLPLTEKYLLNSKMAATLLSIFLVNLVTVIYMRCAHLINDFLRRKPLGIKELEYI
jgi:small neutral amino acid transporter SnatA (MarC family)